MAYAPTARKRKSPEPGAGDGDAMDSMTVEKYIKLQCERRVAAILEKADNLVNRYRSEFDAVSVQGGINACDEARRLAFENCP